MENLNAILKRMSYHAVFDETIIEALKFALDNGFAGIQLADEVPHLSFENLSKKEITEIQKFIEKNNIYISIHAPDNATSLFQYSKFLKNGILRYYNALFSFAENIHTKIITIHAGNIATYRTDTIPEELIPAKDKAILYKTFQKNLDELLRLAQDRFFLCIENYKLDQELLNLLHPYLNNGDIYLCWDIAKSYRRPEIESYFLDNIRFIRQVHLHDFQYLDGKVSSSHRVIGTGEINFKYYLSKLKDADILDYCIEVRPKEKAKESLERLKLIL